MRSAATLVLAILLPVAFAGDHRIASGHEEEPYDWGVIYFMSYDNNLAQHGPTILEGIRAGVGPGRTVASVQADFPDRGGMRRFLIRSSRIEATRVASDDSASEDQFLDYLAWFASNYRCRRYAVVILNHGGKLDAMCLDQASQGGGEKWMSGRVLGEKLRGFRGWSGRWELLFLQQCGRSSLENLYSFRGTARFIMGAPVNVGAPNTYYTRFHRWLERHPDVTGADLAAKIAEFDRDYSIYSCVRTSMLDELPRRLDAAIAPLLRKPDLIAPREVPIIFTSGRTVDAGAYFRGIADENGVGQAEAASFLEWLRDGLQCRAWRTDPGRADLIGLSLYPPPAGGDPANDSLDLFQASQLSALWSRFKTSGANPAAPK